MTDTTAMTTDAAASGPIVVTRTGPVVGRTLDGVQAFLGIPYAQPPFGPNRFQPPVAPDPWGTPREAVEFGPSAPQPPIDDGEQLLPRPDSWGEDCLSVNVWAPASAAGAPVMVFIHGGAFVTGGSNLPTYDGTAFARDGVVLVTLNYRLGVEGFLFTGEGTPNLGLLDQVAALTWVRENIAAFGGDPDNVTVFGESAGAMSVCALMAMPRAAGLFRRAIAQSGAADIAIPTTDALRVATRLAEILHIDATLAAFAAVPMDELLRAQSQLSGETGRLLSQRAWGAIARNFMPFEPVIDGDILPALPRTAIAAGAAHDVDLLIGTNADEANLFFVPNGASKKFSLPVAWLFAHRYGARIPRVRRSYRARSHRSGADITLAVLTDAVYRVPALRVARRHPRTHVYEFAWRSPAYDGALGACHALELAFVFDTLSSRGTKILLGDAPPSAVAETMHAAWVAFASGGDPGWPRYTTAAPVSMRFDETSTIVEDDTVDVTLWPPLDRA